MCCGFPVNINTEYLRDLRRGRAHDHDRWRRISRFAYKRWAATRDLGHANRWRVVIASVDRRKPR